MSPDLIADGAAAGRLLQDAAFRDAINRLDNLYVVEWRRRDTTEAERAILWSRMQALVDVVRELRNAYEHGIATTESEERAERLRRAGL